MNALSALISLPDAEKCERGLAHTPAEIAQQPETWASTDQVVAASATRIRTFLSESGICPDDSGATVLLIGAGTSDYVGRVLTGVLRKNWRCEVMAVPSTDILTNMESYVIPGRRYLWISFSRSGDSSEGVATMELALNQYPEVRHLVVTCNAQGKMAQRFQNDPRVCCLVLDDAVNDRGLAMTSSFTNMVIAGQALANIHQSQSYKAIVDALSVAGANFLQSYTDQIAELARQDYSNACFVGSGALAGVACESALKVVELTAGKIFTMSESTLGLRHGPLAALDADSMVVALLSGDVRRRSYELDLLTELKAKGIGKVRVAVSPVRSNRLESLVHHALYLDFPQQFSDEYRPPVDVLFAQLTGLFASLHRGLKPDAPSPNGAISRVVSHVNIYS